MSCEGLNGHGARLLAESTTRVAVVGASGWLGLATLDLLQGLLGEAFEARVEAFGSQDRMLDLGYGKGVRQRPLADLPRLPAAPTIVLHLAFLTQEKAKVMTEADYIAANRAISSQVLAALDPIGATSVFVPSSGAVYMVDDASAQASMRLYGRLKLEDEARFGQWAEQGARRAVIARVFNLSGRYINKRSSYALACFIADALAGRPIEIRATRPVWRSYVAISELMSVVFGALMDGEVGVVMFDTAGDELHEMDQIAAAVGRVVGHTQGVRRSPLTDAAPDCYAGNGGSYRRLREQFAVASEEFHAQVETTARYLAMSGPGVSPRLGA